jgi:hypothetical protein
VETEVPNVEENPDRSFRGFELYLVDSTGSSEAGGDIPVHTDRHAKDAYTGEGMQKRECLPLSELHARSLLDPARDSCMGCQHITAHPDTSIIAGEHLHTRCCRQNTASLHRWD